MLMYGFIKYDILFSMQSIIFIALIACGLGTGRFDERFVDCESEVDAVWCDAESGGYVELGFELLACEVVECLFEHNYSSC